MSQHNAWSHSRTGQVYPVSPNNPFLTQKKNKAERRKWHPRVFSWTGVYFLTMVQQGQAAKQQAWDGGWGSSRVGMGRTESLVILYMLEVELILYRKEPLFSLQSQKGQLDEWVQRGWCWINVWFSPLPPPVSGLWRAGIQHFRVCQLTPTAAASTQEAS